MKKRQHGLPVKGKREENNFLSFFDVKKTCVFLFVLRHCFRLGDLNGVFGFNGAFA